MRRIIVSALAAAVALSTAGLAVAKLNASGVSATTATFSAAKERSETRTCTGDGKTYEITSGRYVGAIDFADPNSALDGPLAIKVRAVVNKTDGIGWIEGSFRGRDDARRTHARFWGALDGSGNLDGFLQGRANERNAVLLGSLSATFTADGGFAGGKLGNGSTSLPAVLAGRPCKDSKPAGTAVRLSVKGEVTAIDASSITVKPRDGSAVQACKIVSPTSPSTAGIAVGSKVEIHCALVGTDMTLVKLKKTS